jgi:DNA polymerase III subunit epsilon
MYSIIDIETTGGKIGFDKITEIGIVLFDGEKVVKTFETLINPQRNIPYNITKITGITNEMVREAPKFYEVAKEIIEITQDCYFVAHNVHFDYKFIREEFRDLGYNYHRKLLCTLRLSRLAFPQLPSYKLGHLIKHFNIPVKERHRALEDAKATAILFSQIWTQQKGVFQSENTFALAQSKIPLHFTREMVDQIPEECGVYYFYNQEGKIIYIGKSLNIKNRFFEHFNAYKEKALIFQNKVHAIQYQLTGSDLIAQILEYLEIQKYKPEYNKLYRAESRGLLFTLEKEENKNLYDFNIESAKDYNKNSLVLAHCSNKKSAIELLNQFYNQHQLCHCLFEQTLHTQCPAMPEGNTCHQGKNQNPAVRQSLLREIAENLSYQLPGNKIIYDRGRNPEEYSFLLCKNNRVKGYGFIGKADLSDLRLVKAASKDIEETREIRKIYQAYVKKHLGEFNYIELEEKDN